MPEPADVRLVRAIGRWSLIALVVNSIIGSGIFGLPAAVAAKTGRLSPLSFVLGACGMGVIYICFAEVASRFRETGGPYLYARTAFGSFVGLQVGWLNWLSRLASSAANVSLFAVYAASFWPALNQPGWRVATITVLIGMLAAVNAGGVKLGARVSNLLTASKLITLGVFIAGGCAYLLRRGTPLPSGHESYDANAWFSSLLLVVFAYGGFENALIPAGETEAPDHNAPVALFSALAVCVPLYVLIQMVVVQTVANPGMTERPLAVAAGVFGGPGLASFVAAGAILSVLGYLAAAMIAVPRVTLAFAEQKEFPAIFARLHSRFKTPYISITLYAALIWVLAVAGSFSWNAKLSAVPRLVIYAISCASLPVLRRRVEVKAAFRAPFGRALAALGICFCVALLLRASKAEIAIASVVAAGAGINWAALRLAAARSARILDSEPL
jgi:amino acid transporter